MKMCHSSTSVARLLHAVLCWTDRGAACFEATEPSSEREAGTGGTTAVSHQSSMLSTRTRLLNGIVVGRMDVVGDSSI